jgi:predicted aspartyl protease
MSHSFTVHAPALLRELKTDVGIAPAFDPIGTGPHPNFTQFEAIWDTGATHSVVSEKVVNECKLKPVGMTEVHTANGSCDCEVYIINLMLPQKVFFPNIHVTKANLGGKTELLIGMNIITKGDFAVTNKDGKTCFSFRVPSLELIDFGV